MYSLKALLTTSLLLSRAFADLDSNVRASSCRSCLQSVEQMCSGSSSSPGYTDCFCDLDGKPWTYLVDCISSHDTNCNQDQNTILNNYGKQCFQNNVKQESKLCGHIIGHSEQLLYLVKTFCRPLVAPESDTATGTAFAQTTFPSSTTRGHSSTGSGATSTAQADTASTTSGASTSSSNGSETTDSPSSTSESTDSASGAAASTSTREGAGSSLRGLDALGVGMAGLAAVFL